MGYGSKAIELLKDYYEGSLYAGVNKMEDIANSKEEKLENVLLTEEIRPRKLSKPLLKKLNELMPPALDYLGTSYGITPQLYKFWARNEYSPIYLRQMPNETTGEYTCIMIKPLQCKHKDLEEGRIGIKKGNWCDPYVKDYKNRFMSLLGYEFRKLHILSVMNILNFDVSKAPNQKMQAITEEITVNDCLRLESYCNNLVDYHLVIDIIPQLARLYFKGNLPMLSINHIQQCILLGMGLQYKAIETIARELGIEVNQTLPLLNKILRKINTIVKEAIGSHAEKNTQKLEQKEEAHMDKLFKELDTK
jgi:N-acetyltransferase 10